MESMNSERDCGFLESKMKLNRWMFLGGLLGMAAMAMGAHVVEFQVPQHLFVLTDFGGVGDGKIVNTTAFAKAVDAVKTAGGGVLEVPPGTFLTGPFVLTNHMKLLLDAGAVIKATERFADYGLPEPLPKEQADLNMRKSPTPLIGGMDLSDVIIEGEGTIDGSGEVWWRHVNKPSYYTEGAILLPRPRLIAISGTKNLVVRGVTLTNSPTFHLVPAKFENVLIEDVKIIAPAKAPNTDAIDPSGCKNLVIRRCTLDVGDDDLAIKAGGAGHCEDILVTDCTVLHGHGISIGSETNSGVNNMRVQNCTFDGTTPAIRIKSDKQRGGLVTDISYENITMKNISIAFELNMLYDIRNTSANPKSPATVIPKDNNIRMKNITVENAQAAAKIVGLPESKIEDVQFENVEIYADS